MICNLEVAGSIPVGGSNKYKMKSINSISGGQTSAYIAVNYPADYNLFALVRIEDERCRFKDEAVRKQVEDRIQKPFIATSEDDKIIYTMLDLEQLIGKEITWVSGDTFDSVIKKSGGYLPNKIQRFCTSKLKIEPMFYWWAKNIGEPIEMRIGFRANEQQRKARMIDKCNEEGLLEFKATFFKNNRGQNKWETVAWQKPVFPLIDYNPTWKDQIVEWWKDKPVRFAKMNNCVGCFHRSPILLKKMCNEHPEKLNWFSDQEKNNKGTWRSDVSYEKIMSWNPQFELFDDDFTDCDSGSCGL